MLYDLLRHDLTSWHPRAIVRTAALAEQQAESLSGFDAWWEDLLHDGYLPAGNADGEVVSNEYEVRKSAGYYSDNSKKTWFEKRKGLYEQARTSSPELKRKTDAAFGRYLRKCGCTRKRVLRRKGWQLPPLAQCRAEWLTRFPGTVWDQPEITSWPGERDDDGEQLKRGSVCAPFGPITSGTLVTSIWRGFLGCFLCAPCDSQFAVKNKNFL